MPVKTKEFELDDGTKITVKQAGGMKKLRIENIQARVFRDFLHFGLDPTEWTDEQQKEFADAMDNAGAGFMNQVEAWLPDCIIEPKEFDIEMLTSPEIRMILGFVRGDAEEEGGAPPLDNSSE